MRNTGFNRDPGEILTSAVSALGLVQVTPALTSTRGKQETAQPMATGTSPGEPSVEG